MRYLFSSFLIFFSASLIAAQTHQQALDDYARLKSKLAAFEAEIKKEAQSIEKVILQPEEADVATAKTENVNVFRLLPREKYEGNTFSVRGNGAYYSFIKQSHSYDETPQIGLEQNFFKVGFYGASYGLMTDLGKTSLAEINESSKSLNALINYKPPTELSEARIEQTKARGFERENINYKDRLPVVVGHSYVLRAISYDEADTLVAFKVHRKDADGSLIIFWKPIKNYEKPQLARK